MEFLIRVQFDLSEKLYAFLEDRLPNVARRAEKAVTKELGAQARKEMNVSVDIIPVNPPKSSENSEISENSEHSENSEKSETTPAIPTLEDCRAALERTRVRFEGEDYSNHKDSDAYKRYHKPLSAMVKQILLTVSGGKAEKMPQLEESARATFIEMLDELTTDENGDIVAPKAPF